MECGIHPGREAVGACRRCGRPVCELCGDTSQGTFVCARCEPRRSFIDEPFEAGAGAASEATPGKPESARLGTAQWHHRRKSPALATLLSIVPSLGQLYNGQVLKAAVFFALFVALVSLTDQYDLFGLFVVFFWFYQIFDAYHTAREINEAVVVGSRASAAPAAFPGSSAPGVAAPVAIEATRPRAPGKNSRFWGWLLVVMGGLFLLNNVGVPVGFLVARFWPILLMVLGARLLWRYFDAPREEAH